MEENGKSHEPKWFKKILNDYGQVLPGNEEMSWRFNEEYWERNEVKGNVHLW